MIPRKLDHNRPKRYWEKVNEPTYKESKEEKFKYKMVQKILYIYINGLQL